MAAVEVVVESADHDPLSLFFELRATTASVKKVIRESISVMGGGCLEKKKESSSAEVFTAITDDDEVLSSDYSYKFIRGKSGIILCVEFYVCMCPFYHSNYQSILCCTESVLKLLPHDDACECLSIIEYFRIYSSWIYSSLNLMSVCAPLITPIINQCRWNFEHLITLRCLRKPTDSVVGA